MYFRENTSETSHSPLLYIIRRYCYNQQCIHWRFAVLLQAMPNTKCFTSKWILTFSPTPACCPWNDNRCDKPAYTHHWVLRSNESFYIRVIGGSTPTLALPTPRNMTNVHTRKHTLHTIWVPVTPAVECTCTGNWITRTKISLWSLSLLGTMHKHLDMDCQIQKKTTNQ